MVLAKVNPDNIEAHRFLTEWYIKKGDYKKAVREIEAIIRLCPDPDPLSALDSWSQLPEEARLVIMGDVRASQLKWIQNRFLGRKANIRGLAAAVTSEKAGKWKADKVTTGLSEACRDHFKTVQGATVHHCPHDSLSTHREPNRRIIKECTALSNNGAMDKLAKINGDYKKDNKQKPQADGPVIINVMSPADKKRKG
jgi:hypothetical protein